MTDLDVFKKFYSERRPLLDSFATALLHQLSVAIDDAEITLGFPIQVRVKSEQSIEEKLQRKDIQIVDVEKLADLVGLRIIVLYKRDLKRVIKVLSQFKIAEPDDVSQRLGESQFGYNSIHVEVRIPENWLAVPGLRKFGGLHAEIQIRTLAQHLWASASHDLQYKREKSVPAQIRRAISRVSALLETVDLEFERVLDERAHYVDKLQSAPMAPETPLDVESLKVLLIELWPKNTRESWQTISALLHELNTYDINTADKLRNLVESERSIADMADKHWANNVTNGTLTHEADRQWVAEHGTYFSPIGMTRAALESRFGDEYLSKMNVAKLIPSRTATKEPNS